MLNTDKNIPKYCHFDRRHYVLYKSYGLKLSKFYIFKILQKKLYAMHEIDGVISFRRGANKIVKKWINPHISIFHAVIGMSRLYDENTTFLKFAMNFVS